MCADVRGIPIDAAEPLFSLVFSAHDQKNSMSSFINRPNTTGALVVVVVVSCSLENCFAFKWHSSTILACYFCSLVKLSETSPGSSFS